MGAGGVVRELLLPQPEEHLRRKGGACFVTSMLGKVLYLRARPVYTKYSMVSTVSTCYVHTMKSVPGEPGNLATLPPTYLSTTLPDFSLILGFFVCAYVCG